MMKVPCLILLLVGVLGLWACAEEQGVRVTAELLFPEDQNPLNGLETLTIDVVKGSETSRRNRFSYEVSGAKEEDLRLLLRGLEIFNTMYIEMIGSDADGEVQSCGRTGLLPVADMDGERFAIYFALTESLSTPPMRLAQARSSARVLSPDGLNLLVVGGESAQATGEVAASVAPVEVLNMRTYEVDPLLSGQDAYALPGGRVGHTLTVVDGSTALVAGGLVRDARGERYPTAWLYVDLYDAARNQSLAEPPLSPRTGHAAIYRELETSLLLCGGRDAAGTLLSDCASVAAATRTATKTFAMNTPRADFALMTVMDDDEEEGVLFYGGTQDPTQAAEWLDVDAKKPRVLADAPQETRGGATALLLEKGRVLVAGGAVNGTVSRSAVLFDAECLEAKGVSCSVFTELPEFLTTAREHFTLSKVSANVLLACGGYGADGVTLGDCELIEIAEDDTSVTFTTYRTLPMMIGRAGHSAFLLPDGNVVLLGGTNAAGQALSDMEIFVPKMN